VIHVYTVRNLINNLISLSFCSQLFQRNGCKYKIDYYYKKKQKNGPYWISRNTGNFFCFNSSLSNLYNNVIIYNIKKSRENSFVCERNVQNFPIHVIRALYIDVSLYLTLTIQASSRLKRSANHLWNNSDVCRKKFGEWSPLMHSSNSIQLLHFIECNMISYRALESNWGLGQYCFSVLHNIILHEMKCYNCFITFNIPRFFCLPRSIFRDCLLLFFQIQKHISWSI
jgi:hypothetical protein